MLGLLCALVILGGDMLVISTSAGLCSPSPCGKNADCTIRGLKPICSCPRGHEGDAYFECTKKSSSATIVPNFLVHDPCNPMPCGLNTKCTQRGQLPVCSCLLGYEGEVLTACFKKDSTAMNQVNLKEIDLCNPSPCGEGALCTQVGNRPKCSCPRDFEGNPTTKCTRKEKFASNDSNLHKVSICNPSPCGENAVCTSRGTRPICSCLKGYEGNPSEKCIPRTSTASIEPDLQIKDVCKPFSCGENAVCRQIRRRAICSCLAGYEGDPSRKCIKKPSFVSACREEEFQCEKPSSFNNAAQCVFLAEVCDGVENCEDGSDEHEYLCPEFYLECGVQSKIGSCATLDTNCPRFLKKEQSEKLVKYRISGGQVAPIQAWPWMVTIGYRDRNGKLLIICGGSLISNKYVLTAAHCFDFKEWPRGQGIVHVGEYDLESKKDCYVAQNRFLSSCIPDGVWQEIGIAVVRKHPNYRKECRGPCNDIAIVELRKKVKLDGRFVQTICLPQNLKQDIGSSFEDWSKKDRKYTGMVVGWGHTGGRGNRSKVLMQAKLEIGDDNKCNRVIENRFVYPDRNSVFCAGDCSGGPPCKDTCSGDSGGPLMMSDPFNTKWFLTGITSAGPKPCGVTEIRGRYTNVAHYIDWIQHYIRQP